MPHKNKSYNSCNEPYGETYCIDDGLWYDDDTETLPEPLSNPVQPCVFSITSLLGEYCIDDQYGVSMQEKEDLIDCMKWLEKEGNDHIGNFAYNISFQIYSDGTCCNFQYEYPQFRYLKDFIESFLKVKIQKIKINYYLKNQERYLPSEEKFGISDVRVLLDNGEERNIGIQFIDGYYIKTKMLFSS